MAAIRLSDPRRPISPDIIRSALDARAALHRLTERLVMVVAGVTVILLGIWSRSWGRSERLLPPLKARVAADIRCCVRPMTEVRDRPLAVLVGLVAAAVWCPICGRAHPRSRDIRRRQRPLRDCASSQDALRDGRCLSEKLPTSASPKPGRPRRFSPASPLSWSSARFAMTGRMQSRAPQA